MPGIVGITEREKQILGLLVKYKDRKKRLQAVAEALGLSENAVKAALARLRRRYARAHQFIQHYRVWRRRIGDRRYL